MFVCCCLLVLFSSSGRVVFNSYKSSKNEMMRQLNDWSSCLCNIKYLKHRYTQYRIQNLSSSTQPMPWNKSLTLLWTVLKLGNSFYLLNSRKMQNGKISILFGLLFSSVHCKRDFFIRLLQMFRINNEEHFSIFHFKVNKLYLDPKPCPLLLNICTSLMCTLLWKIKPNHNGLMNWQ